MKAHYIAQLRVEKLWGNNKPIDISFHEDVNIIIGPNASGKTTIINLLMYALTGNIAKLIDYNFDLIAITLKSFSTAKPLQVKVAKSAEAMRFEIANRVVEIPLAPAVFRTRRAASPNMPHELYRRHFGVEISELRKQLEGLVPAAWLPVSRRLPLADDDDEERSRVRRGSLESVDECLAELLNALQRYRVLLDAGLSDLRKEFQKHALENILYDKRHDQIFELGSLQAPSQAEKQQLLKAFEDVGLVDTAMEQRVEDHFTAAQDAVAELKKDNRGFSMANLFIIPLIHRTKQMVAFAQDLESKRQKLFAPLTLYESTIRSFIEHKTLTVSKQGVLEIKKEGDNTKNIEWRHLSSGEKQLLILLTQALLWEKDPVVYVADEPELSLHVTWQEKLLRALTSLAGRCQFIVATHSPDIASGFGSKIIDLAKM
jgi:predicted ATP-dependent endonuclease of OLD family